MAHARKALRHLVTAIALITIATSAHAGVSIDRGSPSVTAWGEVPSDIFEPTGALAGWDVGGPGPIVEVLDVNYGLNAADNNNGHSANEISSPKKPLFLHFSGDTLSQGLPATTYRHQANRRQAAGDVFRSRNPTVDGPLIIAAACAGPTILAVGPGHVRSTGQGRFNFIPSILPPVFGPGPQDNLDALELDDMDPSGDLRNDTSIYFTLDAASPSLGFALSSAHILLSPPTSGFFTTWATPGNMGLYLDDDVDALAVWDQGVVGGLDPSTDVAIFSLAPGSPYLAGADRTWGTADDYSAADIFVTDFNGYSCLYLNHGELGMGFKDNVNAIDVEQP